MTYTWFLLVTYLILEGLCSRTVGGIVGTISTCMFFLVGSNFCVVSFNYFPFVKLLFEYLWISVVFDVHKEVIQEIDNPLTKEMLANF